MNGYRTKVNPFIPYFQQGRERRPVTKDILRSPYSRYESYVDDKGNNVLKMYGAQKHVRKGTSALNEYYKKAQQSAAPAATQEQSSRLANNSPTFSTERQGRGYTRRGGFFNSDSIKRDKNGRIIVQRPTIYDNISEETPVVESSAVNPYLEQRIQFNQTPQVEYASYRRTPSESATRQFDSYNFNQTVNEPTQVTTQTSDVPYVASEELSLEQIPDLYPPENGYYTDEYGTIYNPEVNGENEALRYIRQETGEDEVKFLNDTNDFSRDAHRNYASSHLQPTRLYDSDAFLNKLAQVNLTPIEGSDINPSYAGLFDGIRRITPEERQRIGSTRHVLQNGREYYQAREALNEEKRILKDRLKKLYILNQTPYNYYY